MNLPKTALPEVDVADRQSFIDQENLRINVDGDREGEANHHAARICFDRLINELADFGKLGDVREPAVYLFGGESEDRRIEIDIIAAGKFGIEARTQFQECGDPAIHVY